MELNGKITVYESSDGGYGMDNTTWQFFVGTAPVKTRNSYHAETARLAMEKNVDVRVTAADGGTILQIRMEFGPPPPPMG